MPNVIRLKRRVNTGNAQAGTGGLTLVNGEVAYNEVDSVLYYGAATGGDPLNVSYVAIAGSGHYITLGSSQSISGNKTFTGTVNLGASATATTPATGDNDTSVATTAFVKAQNYSTTTGTVTSVGLTGINNFISTGTPITSSGNITMALTSQPANYVLAAPDDSGGTPSFRALVADDIPALNYLSTTSGGTVSGSVTITGNLTINGTTTNINSENIVVEDKNIVLGYVAAPTDATANEGGITLKGATDKLFVWKDAEDAWTSTEHLNLGLTGGTSKNLYLAGNLVLGPQDVSIDGTFFTLDKVVMDGGTY